MLDGLKAGEQVMVDGFQKLRAPGAPVKPVPWTGRQAAAAPAPAASAVGRLRCGQRSRKEPARMAKFFIDRPIFAWVIALFIIVLGGVADHAAADRAVPAGGAALHRGLGHLSGRLGARRWKKASSA